MGLCPTAGSPPCGGPTHQEKCLRSPARHPETGAGDKTTLPQTGRPLLGYSETGQVGGGREGCSARPTHSQVPAAAAGSVLARLAWGAQSAGPDVTTWLMLA